MSEKKKKGFWEKMALKKISEAVAVQKGEDLFLLSDKEIQQLYKIRLST